MADWYFAYGSNLWIDQMVRRTGPMGLGDDRPRLARLRDYRLEFNMRGDSGQIFANIVRPGDGVRGVAYRCGPETLKRLDAFESGYDRQPITVTDDRGDHFEAIAYVAKPEYIVERGMPSADYLERIVRGARQHGLPEAYIQSIMTIAASSDA